MPTVRERLRSTWRRVFDLSWPVMVEQVTRTAMRTTDVFVTGLFSPAAIAAVGLADLYARFPLRIGLGLGGGAIALSSQDTGAAEDEGSAAAAAAADRAAANRDEAVTQAVLLGALAGIPFAAFGLAFGREAIALLGAAPEVARQGGLYLAIIFATSPFRHVALIAARSLQGTGDTRTPMAVNVAANVLNISGSLVLGLGLLGAPRLAVAGVGLATAAGNVFSASALSLAIAGNRVAASFTWPSDLVIARQLVTVSAPRVAEGLVATAAEFPFNALLLGFGTEVNAAYQIGRRMYQQVTGPLSRGYNVAASVVVGQALGERASGTDGETATFLGWSTAALGLVTVGTVGLVLAALAEPLAGLFTDDATTLRYAVDYARVYGLGAPFLVTFVVVSGALQGAGDTTTPFVARTVGLFGCYLGVSYLLGVVLGWGPLGTYVGVFTYYLVAAAIVLAGFRWGGWADRAAEMMAERGSADGD
jgi:putative MATE family efflux protein